MFSKRNPSRVHTGKHRSHNKNGGQARPPSNRALRLIFGSQNTIVSHHVTPRYLSSRQCRFRMFSADKKSRSICSFPHVTAPDTQHGLQALRLYYNQTQSSQDPKRSISCTKVVLIRRGISWGAENISPHYFSASVAIIIFFFFSVLGPRHYDSITL